MNLYLLTQNENSGYDTYDSCVVAAENLDQARMIRPSYPEWDASTSNDWASSPENVNVELLGLAVCGTEPGVICASFNAG